MIPFDPLLPDLCASIQAAIVEVLVAKTLSAAGECAETLVAVSGGVSLNSGLRAALATACHSRGLDLRLAARELTTDNAAMIAAAGLRRLQMNGAGALDFNAEASLLL